MKPPTSHWIEVGLGLGSNLGERLTNLNCAREAILSLDGVRHADSSPVYETEPVDARPEHADKPYLNAVLIIRTCRSAGDLAEQTRNIENVLGRERDAADRNAPRTLDIDILYFGDRISADPALTLPHPECMNRRFVCQPLAMLRPERLLPGQTQSVSERLAALPTTPEVKEYDAQWCPLPSEL